MNADDDQYKRWCCRCDRNVLTEPVEYLTPSGPQWDHECLACGTATEEFREVEYE